MLMIVAILTKNMVFFPKLLNRQGIKYEYRL